MKRLLLIGFISLYRKQQTTKVEREDYLVIQFCDLVNSIRFLAEKLLDLVSELLFCYCEIKYNAKYIKAVQKIF